MTIKEIVSALDAKVVTNPNSSVNITKFYAGDFLSRVMGKAPEGCAWFTVMANVNVAGVAVLADVKAVVLCEGVIPDLALKSKCESEGIALLVTDKPVYDCCRLVC